ncbi:MAG: 50S ribosomal protein L11 [Candidatus Micrarchaeota archaeon]|nr:50S ribosomal protein L11 [Candidatus Micrarchaeota archaeon]MDE1834561.1 50S ribosomal protein L11 [Candidatus Micrarchaeota archaeon]MDE1859881.1 50S ribosomal protein L11 [Candidatus Micrarchaeota archaeon]
MAEVVVNGLIEGGKATSGPPFGPALGPLGVNTAAIVAEINAKTKAFDGIKVPVKVTVDKDTKKFTVEVGSPATSALILKELGLQKGGKVKEEIAGNITIEQIKKIAKAKEASMYGNSLKSRVKQVIGTCKSMNITVEGIGAKEMMAKVESGEVKV